jgi:hypothetical protein
MNDEPIALLPAHIIKCLECKEEKTFDNYRDFNKHLKQKHGDITREQYAEKWKTEQWHYCFKCRKGVYKDRRTYEIILYDGIVVLGCKEHWRLAGAFIIKITDPTNERIKKGHKTMREFGDNHQASLDGWETRRKNGTEKLGAEKQKQYWKDHPEEKKTRAQKAVKIKRMNGNYDFDNMSKISKKGWENTRADPKKLEQKLQKIKKGLRRSIENGNFQKGQAKRRKTLKERYGKYSTLFPVFSLESQELFIAIEKNLPKELNCYYAIKENENFGIVSNGVRTSGEFQIWHESNRFCRFLDFYIKEINVCIEFDEDGHEHEKAKKNDLIRENDIKRAIQNIKIFRVKKRDYLSDKNKVLKRCLDFICQCAEHSLHFQKSIVLEVEHLAPLEAI